jgi:hypothetical protein
MALSLWDETQDENFEEIQEPASEEEFSLVYQVFTPRSQYAA